MSCDLSTVVRVLKRRSMNMYGKEQRILSSTAETGKCPVICKPTPQAMVSNLDVCMKRI